MKAQSERGDVFSSLYSREEYKAEVEEKEEEEEQSWFVGYSKFCGKLYKGQPNLTEEYQVALAFLGWDLKAEEVNSAPIISAMLAFFIGILFIVVDMFVLRILQSMPVMYILPLFLLPMGALYYMQTFPIKEAEIEKVRAATFIPEIVNYLVMSMKVTPNLEKAVEFAAKHGHGRIARDLRDLQWRVKVGAFLSIEEALNHLAWKWGAYSEEFKHALMLIRACVIEPDDLRREMILDRAISDTLEGIRDKMDIYSRAMHQPSIYLYYFGVLLPLLLIIIIPVGAMMGGGGVANLGKPAVLCFIYNILIPIGSLLLAKNILRSRPPTREPPKVPLTIPGLPKAGWFNVGGYQLPVPVVSAAIFIMFVFAGYFLNPILNPMPEIIQEAARASYLPILVYAGYVCGLASAFGFYLWANYKDRRAVQLEIMRMEQELQDVLYVLASRLGEGKPIEDAMQHTMGFLPKSVVCQKILKPTADNMAVMAMTLKIALFDKQYGALKHIPSHFIKTSMRIVADAMDLGVKTAARSLISLSVQLRDSYRVEKALKEMLSDITTMMGTMATFIAPVVLGITTSLQKIISSAMASMAKTGVGTGGGMGGGVAGMPLNVPTVTLGAGSLEAMASQTQLIAIIAIYMIEIVTILIFFASEVNEGKNDLAFKTNLAFSLPLAMIVFFVVNFFAMQFTAVGL